VFIGLVFWMAGGNVGAWAIPLNVAMGAIYWTGAWFFEEPGGSGNIVSYCMKRIPLSVAVTLLGFVPAYAIAVPARLLVEDYPIWYALWCGVGYPMLAFVIRKAFLNYTVKLFMKAVEDGHMTPKQLIAHVSTMSFIVATSLIFGNTMLLYLSSTKTYALAGALSSIGTEVAGKMYTVKTTHILMGEYLKVVVGSNSRAIAKLAVRAQAEGGIGAAIRLQKDLADELRQKQAAKLQEQADNLEGMACKDPSIQLLRDEAARLEAQGDKSEVMPDGADNTLPGGGDNAEEDDVDEKTTEEYWNEVLAMFALRWSNEIVAEKSCIVVAGVFSYYAGISPHSTADQIQIFLIFIVCEAVADLLLVYSLDRWFKVPFLSLPHDIKHEDKDFWVTMLILSLNVAGPCLGFIHAHGSAEEWFPDAGIAGNGTNATLMDVTNSAA
jgi:hypothetical protein